MIENYSKTILIDPGHGGRDPGAVGPRGHFEKTVVFNVANYMSEFLALAGLIKADILRVERNRNNPDTINFLRRFGGVDAYLASQREKLQDNPVSELYATENDYFFTRKMDVFIPLRDRVRISKNVNADIFISLHCNGFHNPDVNGSEIFYLTGNPEGKKLSEAIFWEIIQETGWHNRGVKPHSRFTVLRGYNASIPACLVEFDFITNPRMEELLVRPATQKLLAKCILKGIEEYLR